MDSTTVNFATVAPHLQILKTGARLVNITDSVTFTVGQCRFAIDQGEHAGEFVVRPAVSDYRNERLAKTAWTIPMHAVESKIVRYHLATTEEVAGGVLYRNMHEILGEEGLAVVAFFIANASRSDQTRPRTLHLSGPAAARKSTLVSYICMTLASVGERSLSRDYLGPSEFINNQLSIINHQNCP